MKQIKKLLNLSFVLAITLGLTGCFDLGSFGIEDRDHNIKERNYEEYYKDLYDSIGTIYLYGQDESSDSYNLKDDLFNKETVNDMKTTIEASEYILMVFEIEKGFSIDALSMFVKADENLKEQTQLDIYLYLFDTTSFSTLCPYDEEEIYKKDKNDEDYLYDLDGNKIFKDFDLPSKKDAIGNASTKVEANKWNSFSISTFNGNKTKELKEGDCLGICFYNNTGYQKAINNESKDETLKRKKVSIYFTNLMIRGL